MSLQIIDPTQYPNWDKLLVSTPGSSFFHTSAWAKVLRDSYGYTPLYFAILGAGGIEALIPVMEVKSFITGKRGVSLPFTDHCDSIIQDRFQHQDLFDSIIEYGQNHGWKSVELRGEQNCSPSALRSSIYLGHTLDLLQSEDKIFAKFRDSTRRNIKKAQKIGVKVNISNSLDSVQEFYRLNCITRKEHGLPPQPRYFFKRVYEHILSQNLGSVTVASYEGRNIAGNMYFHFGNKVMFKYGASDRKYQNLRASNLTMWKAIQWYCKNGYKTLDFGRTEPENEGLKQFKKGWGTIESIINYYKYDLRKNDFVADYQNGRKLHHYIFNKMPVPLLSVIGSLLYKHVG